MKNYTDLEQSKTLAEFLSLESADMIYMPIMDIDSMSNSGFFDIPECYPFNEFKNSNAKPLPCWSLAALLDVLQKTGYFIDEDANVTLCSYKTVEWNLGVNNSDLELVTESNPIDACYEMIIKLKDLNLL